MHVKFRIQVNQKSLTYVDPARAAAKQGLRQALGEHSSKASRCEFTKFGTPTSLPHMSGARQLSRLRLELHWVLCGASPDTRAGGTSGSSSRSTAALTLQGKRCCGLAAGKEHELQLRKEADAVEPEKLAKRKHQISSLYHAAKLKVTCWSCSNPPCR